MKYGIAIPSLLLVLGVSLYAQHASSQVFDLPVFDPSTLFDSNTGLPEGIQEQISITQVPTIPQPGQQVSVRVTGYSTDLNKAKITWTLDGKVLSSQTGATTFAFNAPANGVVSRLVITIVKEDGGVISRTLVINPADVDLIYEAETYAHPFYKGKRLYTSESEVNFIAIPNFLSSNGTKIPASSLIYTWKVNGTVLQNVSGYGKHTYSTKGTLIERPSTVTVDVSAVNSTLKATQSIQLQSTTPTVTLYENNPLLGIVYEKAIEGSFVLERPQVDFEGVPYFFSGDYKDSTDFNFAWYINGNRITSKAPNENYMVLRNDNNDEGKAVINVALNHTKNILQTTGVSLNLDFKKVENDTNEQFSF